MRLPIHVIAVLASASVGTACWAQEHTFTKRSERIWARCGHTSGTQVEYHAPSGWRIVKYDAGWVGLSHVGGHAANVMAHPNARPTNVVAKGTITGRQRGPGMLGRGCPASGHGWLEVAGTVAR